MSPPRPRTGFPENGNVQITTADGNTPQTALTIPSDALYLVTAVKIAYDDAANTTTDVTLYDDADGTAAGDVADQRDVYMNVTPGEVRMLDELSMRDVEEAVLFQADGNQDGNLELTVYGELLRALRDIPEG